MVEDFAHQRHEGLSNAFMFQKHVREVAEEGWTTYRSRMPIVMTVQSACYEVVRGDATTWECFAMCKIAHYDRRFPQKRATQLQFIRTRTAFYLQGRYFHDGCSSKAPVFVPSV